MKKLFSIYRQFIERYRHKKRCRLYYRTYCRAFWLYAEKTDNAANAIEQAERVMEWFKGLEEEYKDYL